MNINTDIKQTQIDMYYTRQAMYI